MISFRLASLLLVFGIVHAFSTLLINSFRKLVYSPTSPALDHYNYLLPCDQIVGLLLENSLIKLGLGLAKIEPQS
jgi:hypothetical protein